MFKLINEANSPAGTSGSEARGYEDGQGAGRKSKGGNIGGTRDWGMKRKF